jgi:hypothetical protein
MDYMTARCVGFVTYCDALIARGSHNNYTAFLMSLVGTAANIKTMSALLYKGEEIRLSEKNDPDYQQGGLRCGFIHNSMTTCRTRKIGETINKIMIHDSYVSSGKGGLTAVIFGPDMSTVQERAFLRLDAATTIPLKPQWQSWLWDEVMQPEKLLSFGGEDLQQAYLITWPNDDVLQERVLEAVSLHYLN